MNINARGERIVEQCEELYLEAYLCPAKIPTIGYGHTGPDVFIGMPPITRERAEELLDQDLRAAERQVGHSVTAELNENQFSALVSLCFNIGAGRFAHADIVEFLNNGQIDQASAEFPLWCHCRGKVEAGLVKRRALERELFLEEALCPVS